jgi:polysaccharide pyruvyl transferase WcaK-like protein
VTENVKQFPDPAFALQPQKTKLPFGFSEGNTIGINISPMILRYEEKDGITIMNYRKLIDHILETTDCHIALIPHVMWKYNDDRLTIHELYGVYQGNDRVVKFEDMSCQMIKYVISRCRAFIGARTHSTIAAYSSMVPTLVVGYSVKAKGIARDIFGTWENYVLPVQTLSNPEELIGAFEWMMEREEEIRGQLQKVMPDYCKKAAAAGDEIRRLWRELHGSAAE